MKVRELIALLHDISETEDIREFEVKAYDADDERWRSATGVTWDARTKRVAIHTDEL